MRREMELRSLSSFASMPAQNVKSRILQALQSCTEQGVLDDPRFVLVLGRFFNPVVILFLLLGDCA
jgi:hypothetical protein|tara:strand:- start:393 stop:590 length:198 start_codon:yes stop_codon:yes gene_type:complete